MFFMTSSDGGSRGRSGTRTDSLSLESPHAFVRRRLTQMGHDQAWLARQLGMSEATVSRTLHQRRPVTLDELSQLAAALNLDVVSLVAVFTGEGRRAPDQVPVAGVIRGTGDVAELPDGQASHTFAPTSFECREAFLVATGELGRRYLPGEVVFTGQPLATGFTATGTECVVTLTDGRRLLRLVQPGTKRGRYTLVSYAGDVELDAAVAVVSPVVWSRRGDTSPGM